MLTSVTAAPVWLGLAGTGWEIRQPVPARRSQVPSHPNPAMKNGAAMGSRF